MSVVKISCLLICWALHITLIAGVDYCTNVGNSNGRDATIGTVSLKGETKRIDSGKLCPITNLRDLTAETADLVRGKTYTLKWTADTCGNSYSKWGKVYIDWYGEGWTGSGPYANNKISDYSGVATFLVNAKFTVPQNANIGKTRMRIVLEETADDTKVFPCALFTFGGTTDYSIEIIDSVPDSDEGGISDGSIFLILLFVGGFCYLIAGMAYKFQVKGVRGIEMIPNLDFWRALPGYVKDGCKYSWFKIMQCKSRYIDGRASAGGSNEGGGLVNGKSAGSENYDL